MHSMAQAGTGRGLVNPALDSTFIDRLKGGRLLALVLAYAAVLVAARRYEGIDNDAELYALQGLAALRPVPLAGDIFLAFGSQNNFTIFPRLVAPLIGSLGLETAAAAATLACWVGLLCVTWLLARRLTGRAFAWLTVGLLITVPGWYGAGEVFQFDEAYLTARLPAEVLSMLSILAVLQRRWWAALALAAAAMLMHPIMAAPAIVIDVLLGIDAAGQGRTSRRLAEWALAAGTTLVVLTAVVMAPAPHPQHEVLLGVLRARTSYVFLGTWRWLDWLQNALGLATAFLAARALGDRPDTARLAQLVLIVGLTGLAVAAASSAFPRFEPLILLQSWRWPWLTRFFALLLLPGSLVALWRKGPAARACALLLGSGWVLFEFAGGALASVAVALWLVRARLSEDTESLVLRGAWLLTFATIALMLAMVIQAWPLALDTNRAPAWVQQAVNVASLSGPSAVLVIALWLMMARTDSRVAPAVIMVVAAVVLAGVLPLRWSQWTRPRYSVDAHLAFAPWRALIPVSAEVLWHEDPVAVWALLERRSFLSPAQTAGLLYSPRALPELTRRSEALAPLASPGWWAALKTERADAPKDLDLQILRSICQEPGLSFVVDRHDLGIASAQLEWPGPKQYVYLYDCRPLRRESAR